MNRSVRQSVKPEKEFYEKLSTEQIEDIITNIQVHREIPLKYSYVNVGAAKWDAYNRALFVKGPPSALARTRTLLSMSIPFINGLVEDYTKVNIVDLGPGNALPVQGILEHFSGKKILNKYIGIDTSKEMLDIAKNNIRDWFDGKIDFKSEICDLGHDQFDSLLSKYVAKNNGNLVFFLGGTISNFRDPAKVLSLIYSSLKAGDIFLTSRKLDNPQSRQSFVMADRGNQELTQVLNLIGVDESYYSLEKIFDEQKMTREIYIRFKQSMTIKIDLSDKEHTIELGKDERILIWRARHQTALEALQELDDANFTLLQASCTPSADYLLTISRKN